MKTGLTTRYCSFCAAIWIVVFMEIAAIAQLKASGIVVYNDGRSDYPAALAFEALNRNGPVYSNAVLPSGKRVEIPNAGIVAIIDAPPAKPDAKIAATAFQVFQQIDSVLRKYPRSRFPQIAQRLDALSERWRAAEASAQSAKAPAAPVAISTGTTKLTITTNDGQHYADVLITKIDAESVSFEHSTGVATIPLAKLPPDLQRKFNYNPQKPAATDGTKLTIDPTIPTPSGLAKNGDPEEPDRDYIPQSELVTSNLKKLGWSPELGKTSDKINAKMHGVIDFPEKLPASMDALFEGAFRSIADQLDKSEKICAKDYSLNGFASNPPADDLETKIEWNAYTRGSYEISEKVCGYAYGVFCGVRVGYINAIALDTGVPDALIRSPENWFSDPKKLSNAFAVGATGDVDARVESTFGKHTLAEQSERFQTEFQKGVVHGYGEGIRLYMYGKLKRLPWQPFTP